MRVSTPHRGREHGGRFPVRTTLLAIALLVVVWVNFFQDTDVYVSDFSATTTTTTSSSSNNNDSNNNNNDKMKQDSSSSSVEIATTLAAPEYPTFLEIAKATGTDKVEGHQNLACVKEGNCMFPNDTRETCRPWGHFYDTIYDRWLKPYLTKKEPIQFLEIGYFRGKGFEAFSKYLAPNQQAELHSMEITCRDGEDASNTAERHPWYKRLLDSSMLHCGDAGDYNFLHDTWIRKMKRNGEGPPLKVVVDDGSHLHGHMATSLFFWFPRIEPGGVLIIEDIQPIKIANKFRTHIIPQVMKDLHWCGGPRLQDSLCFPTIQPFLQGVHCEMHICVFQRNNKPSVELSKADSVIPEGAFSGANKCLFGPHD